MRIGEKVDIGEPLHAVDRIGNRALAAPELPALRAHYRLHNRQRNGAFEPLELAEDEGAVRPRAAKGDIEMVTPRLRRKTRFPCGSGAAVARDPTAEARGRSQEAPAGRFRVVPFIMPNAVDEQAHLHLLAPRAGPRGDTAVRLWPKV